MAHGPFQVVPSRKEERGRKGVCCMTEVIGRRGSDCHCMHLSAHKLLVCLTAGGHCQLL